MIPFYSILDKILFEVYLIISGDDYFFLSAIFISGTVFFFGTDTLGFDEYFWLLAELCEFFRQTRLEVFFLPIKHAMLS
jgi:hypothetical protein